MENRYQDIKTPAYIYDLDNLQTVVQSAMKAAAKRGFHIHYAVKANVEHAVFDVIKKAGMGADCVSSGEVKFAIEQGVQAKDVFFAGVGKTDAEINAALDLEIGAFNVEGLHELQVINELAKAKNVKAKVALRVNPNVEAQTHKYISTGKHENKFGFSDLEWSKVFTYLKEAHNIELVGLHFHIGSQITNLEVFKNLCIRVNEYIDEVEGQGWKLSIINVGGGLGVNYEDHKQNPDFESFFTIFEKNLKLKKHHQLHFELGRSLVATCGTLATKILYAKKSNNKNWMVVDAGMTELLRPALYQAFHNITATKEEGEKVLCDVVGPICESSDTLGTDVLLPNPERGDVLLVHTVGAYGAVMKTNYNMRESAHTYFIEKGNLFKK